MAHGKDPSTNEKRKESFLQELQHFHETKGTPSRRSPKINGHEIDLFLLYTLVTNRGGWLKVNSRNEWDDVLDEFHLPKHCVNSAVAIKQIYLRYLDRYEKIHYLGEIGERAGDDDEDSRHRRWSARALHSVPLTYNHAQHNVIESMRDANGLTQDLYKPTDYEKLGLSLISPLSNEQDFAINVCTLMANNDGRNCLRLERDPKILHFLLAHAAVFAEPSLRPLMMEHYSQVRGHSLSHWWSDVLRDKSLLRFSDEKLFIRDKSNVIYLGPPDRAPPTPAKGPKTSNLVIEDGDMDLFCLGRTLGLNDYVGQRVLQIAGIMRNLSFDFQNNLLMAKDVTLLRFALMLTGSNWSNLSQIGWDLLGNLAANLTVQMVLIEEVISLSVKAIHSQDRARLVAGLETIYRLGQSDLNEEILLKLVDQSVYDKVCSMLTVKDIRLLVYVLECLYSLSSMGEKACNSILRVGGVVDVLVSLLTVEAQSYGADACIQMKVTETVSGGMYPSMAYPPPLHHPNSVMHHAPHMGPHIGTHHMGIPHHMGVPPPHLSGSPQMAVPHQMGLPHQMGHPHQMVLPHQMGVPPQMGVPHQMGAPPQMGAPHPHQMVVSPSMGGPPQMVQAPLCMIPAPSMPPHLNPSHHSSSQLLHAPSPTPALQTTPHRVVVANNPAMCQSPVPTPQHVAQENENFAATWLRSSFEPNPKGLVEQGELYKQYINSCAKVGRRGVIAPLHFPHCVRSVFGLMVGPRLLMTNEGPQHFYEGIQVRSKFQAPSTPVSSMLPPGATCVNNMPGTPSPILKAQLSAPPKPQTTPSTPKLTQRQQQQKRLQQEQQMQQQQQQQLSQPSFNHMLADSSPSSPTKPGIGLKINGVRPQNVEVPEGLIDGESLPSPIERHPPPKNLTNQSFTKGSNNLVQPSVILEESGSAGNSMASSTGGRDNYSGTGGEEGDNSMGSFDAFLMNGVPNSLECEDTSSKDSVPKSLMLADLLEKNVDKNEPPVLNGSLRISDKGLELIQGINEPKLKSSNGININGVLDSKEEKIESLKRPSGDAILPPPKKRHMNGDVKSKGVSEGEHVSPSAANTYIALAADTLEEETMDEAPTRPSACSTQALPDRVSGSPVNDIDGSLAAVPTDQVALAQGQALLVAGTSEDQLTANSSGISHVPSTNVGSTAHEETSSNAPNPSTDPVVPSSYANQPQPSNPPEEPGLFLCEWRGCMRSFKYVNDVYMHAFEAHTPQGTEEIQCLWERCDVMKRKRLSHITHLFDRHCNPEILYIMAKRRKQISVSGRTEIPPPSQPSPHPGYAPNAAFHAIKRHALEFANPKEFQQRAVLMPGPAPPPVQLEQDENEGPVTKSIRLSSALIIRNLVIYSSHGKRHFARYESHLANIAMSNVESSRTISQILYDLSQPSR